MEAVALKRAAMVQKMRQLAHDRTIKLTDMKHFHEKALLVDAAAPVTSAGDSSPSKNRLPRLMSTGSTAEGLEREINSLWFDWDAMPQLIKDKAQRYLLRAKEMATRNDELRLLSMNQQGDPSPPQHNHVDMDRGVSRLEGETVA